jgi:hypothetical protein
MRKTTKIVEISQGKERTALVPEQESDRQDARCGCTSDELSRRRIENVAVPRIVTGLVRLAVALHEEPLADGTIEG